MPFEGKARVQALATLFDYGTEDAQGRTHSQKRTAQGLATLTDCNNNPNSNPILNLNPKPN